MRFWHLDLVNCIFCHLNILEASNNIFRRTRYGSNGLGNLSHSHHRFYFGWTAPGKSYSINHIHVHDVQPFSTSDFNVTHIVRHLRYRVMSPFLNTKLATLKGIGESFLRYHQRVPYCTIYRGPGFLAVIDSAPSPHPSPHLLSVTDWRNTLKERLRGNLPTGLGGKGVGVEPNHNTAGKPCPL